MSALGTEIPGHSQEQLWQALNVAFLAHFYSDHGILKSVKIALLTRPGLVLQKKIQKVFEIVFKSIYQNQLFSI